MFVQRGIRAVKLRYTTFGVYLRIDTDVSWLGDVLGLCEVERRAAVSSIRETTAQVGLRR